LKKCQEITATKRDVEARVAEAALKHETTMTVPGLIDEVS